LHYNAVNAYRPHNFDSVFTTSQNYTFNVHKITTSQADYSTFFSDEGTDKNTAQT